MMSIVSKRTHLADMAFAAVRDFYFSSRYAHDRDDPETCDFTFGNPHEMSLEGIAFAIRERAVPQDKNWFAFKTSEPEPQAFLADQVGRERGLSLEPTDIALTACAFAASPQTIFPKSFQRHTIVGICNGSAQMFRQVPDFDFLGRLA